MRRSDIVRLARIGVLFFGLIEAGQALAQPPPAAADCAAPNSGLPAELAAWTDGVDRVASASANGLAQARLTPGVTVHLTLRPGKDVTFPRVPEKAPAPESGGGLVSLSIHQPGTYRIALSTAAWIDVVKDGQFQSPIAHAHGPACTTIRKMVDFALTPGDYLIQLSGAPDAGMDLLVVPVS